MDSLKNYLIEDLGLDVIYPDYKNINITYPNSNKTILFQSFDDQQIFLNQLNKTSHVYEDTLMYIKRQTMQGYQICTSIHFIVV